MKLINLKAVMIISAISVGGLGCQSAPLSEARRNPASLPDPNGQIWCYQLYTGGSRIHGRSIEIDKTPIGDAPRTAANHLFNSRMNRDPAICESIRNGKLTCKKNGLLGGWSVTVDFNGKQYVDLDEGYGGTDYFPGTTSDTKEKLFCIAPGDVFTKK